MTDLEAFEIDPVGTIIDSMGDDEFMEMLRVALSKDLTPADFSLRDGFPCLWDCEA